MDGGAGAGLRNCGFWAIIVGDPAPTGAMTMAQNVRLN